jgi:hypothetical protein
MDESANTDAWLFGWDPMPGIVSIWADRNGRALVWQRTGDGVRCSEDHFRPWVFAASLDDVRHLGTALSDASAESADDAPFSFRELAGSTGSLRYLLTARDGRALHREIVAGAKSRLGRDPSLGDLTFVYAPDESWTALAEDLSRTLHCLALFVSVYDNDIFEYALYDEGRPIDQYNSAPDYWDGEEWPGHPAEGVKHQPEPSGGDAMLLCALFGATDKTEKVAEILHPPVAGRIRVTGLGAYKQHWEFAEALGWPPIACITAFGYLEEGEVDDDLVLAFGGVPPIRTGA